MLVTLEARLKLEAAKKIRLPLKKRKGIV